MCGLSRVKVREELGALIYKASFFGIGGLGAVAMVTGEGVAGWVGVKGRWTACGRCRQCI